MKNNRIVWIPGTCIAFVVILSGCKWIGSARTTPQASLPYPYPISTIGSTSLDTLASPLPASVTSSPMMADLYPPPGEEGPYPGVQATAGAYPAPGLSASNTESISPVVTPGALTNPELAYPAPFGGSVVLATPTPDFGGVSEVPPLSSTVAITPSSTTVLVRTKIEATNPVTVNLAAGKPQLVEFFAHWCTLCKSMAPIVHVLEDKYHEKINFIYLDVDDPKTADLRAQLGYQLITKPHFYLLDGQGNLIRDWIGYTPGDEFEKTLLIVLGE